jgi:acylphosphatase
MPAEPIRLRVLYTGHVQGVGFRATATHIAGHHAVSGTVRNLPGGEVELEAQGPREEVDAFLAEVQEVLGSRIREAAVQNLDPAGEQSAGFRIIY